MRKRRRRSRPSCPWRVQPAQEDYEAEDASYPGEEGPSPVWELALYGKECVVCEGDQGDMSKPGKVILEAL